MTIEKWLSDVYQDTWMGKNIYNKETDGSSQIIAEIRGWGAIQHLFKTKEESEQFQDEVGKFIVEAIREKIAKTSYSIEISDEEIEKFATEKYAQSKKLFSSHHFSLHDLEKTFIQGMKIYREQLRNKND